MAIIKPVNFAKVVAGVALFALAASALPAFAQSVPESALNGQASKVYHLDVLGVLDSVISVVFYLLMLVAIIFILWAAFNYLTASGNPEKLEKAQKMIMYAVIAIVVGLLARSVPWIVSNFVQTNVTGSNDVQSIPLRCPNGMSLQGTCL